MPEFVPLLHDRMTETVLLDNDLGRVFAGFETGSIAAHRTRPKSTCDIQ